MKIVEGLKRLKLIKKRMEQNLVSINKYSSKLSIEKPIFETDEKQKQEVKSLIQANFDLAIEFLKLKKQIEFTNLKSILEINGVQGTISDFLAMKRTMNDLKLKTLIAMNDDQARGRMRTIGATMGGGEKVTVELLYDEATKNKMMRELQDLHEAIDGRLEVFNATTDLLEFE